MIYIDKRAQFELPAPVCRPYLTWRRKTDPASRLRWRRTCASNLIDTFDGEQGSASCLSRLGLAAKLSLASPRLAESWPAAPIVQDGKFASYLISCIQAAWTAIN